MFVFSESYSFPGVGGRGVEDRPFGSGGKPDASGLVVADEQLSILAPALVDHGQDPGLAGGGSQLQVA